MGERQRVVKIDKCCEDCPNPRFQYEDSRWSVCVFHLLEITTGLIKNGSTMEHLFENLRCIREYFQEHPEEALEC